ncbi:MAG: DUF1348 family protein, partial [Acidimicrobiales bacterium]
PAHRRSVPKRVARHTGCWFRSYGKENWKFDDHGYMRRREASINDVQIDEADCRIRGPRQDGDSEPLAVR